MSATIQIRVCAHIAIWLMLYNRLDTDEIEVYNQIVEKYISCLVSEGLM
jgi:hypothetical protein